MVLKECQIISSSIGRTNSIKKNINWQTRAMCSMFFRCLSPRVKTEKIWKVIIELSQDEPLLSDALGVMSVRVVRDPAEFLALEVDQKKRATLKIIEEGMSIAAEQLGLDSEPFRVAAERVRERNYMNTGSWPKTRIMSPSRRRFASVRFTHDVEYFDAVFEITNRSRKHVASSPAFRDIPNEFVFMTKLSRLHWQSDDLIILDDFFGNRVAEYLIPPDAEERATG